MARFAPGDRIEVTASIDEHAPLLPGETGTVIRTANEGGPFEQMVVAWNSGRTLMLVPADYDSVRVTGRDRTTAAAAKQLGADVIPLERRP